MIFTGALDSFSFTQIEDFCKQFSEGIHVEYAESTKKDIAKAVASLANTMGGVIVLGVVADDSGKVTAIPGLASDAQVEDGIYNACNNGIYPPLLPEVKIYKEDSPSTRIIAVIRVAESWEAPHAITNRERVYIRTGSQSSPDRIKLADIDRLAYLLERRKRPLEIRERIIERAEEKSHRLLASHFSGTPEMVTVISPMFIYKPIVTVESLHEFSRSFKHAKILGDMQRGFEGVYRARVNSKPTPSGTILREGGVYTEYSIYGVLFRLRRESYSRAVRHENDATSVLTGLGIRELAYELVKILEVAKGFYESRYMGALEIRCELRIPTPPLKFFLGARNNTDRENLLPYDSQDKSILAVAQSSGVSLAAEASEITQSLLVQLATAFNVSESIAVLEAKAAYVAECDEVKKIP